MSLHYSLYSKQSKPDFREREHIQGESVMPYTQLGRSLTVDKKLIMKETIQLEVLQHKLRKHKLRKTQDFLSACSCYRACGLPIMTEVME